MSDAPNILSPSFPDGLQNLRSEAEVRALKSPQLLPKPCPFCATDPGLATANRFGGGYMVGCDNDDCHVNPQVSGKTVAEAWARWNQRPREINSDLLAALKECAADFVMPPCLVEEAHFIAREEFLRRMEIARAAIEKATSIAAA